MFYLLRLYQCLIPGKDVPFLGTNCLTVLLYTFAQANNHVEACSIGIWLVCRLQRIRDIAGPSGQDDAALDALMQGDFDPDQYDKQMAAAFGDEYYGVRCSLCAA